MQGTTWTQKRGMLKMDRTDNLIIVICIILLCAGGIMYIEKSLGYPIIENYLIFIGNNLPDHLN